MVLRSSERYTSTGMVIDVEVAQGAHVTLERCDDGSECQGEGGGGGGR
jgi:hypothetical protein